VQLSDLAPQQREAYQRIQTWFEGPDQLFYLAGWAGTGKTSIAMCVAEALVGLQNTLFAAYTGKAAYVMQTRGCNKASTMHSFMYCPADRSQDNLKEAKDALSQVEQELLAEGYEPDALADHPKIQMLQGIVDEEQRKLRRPRFVLNAESIIKHMRLSVLDEVSMVDERMGGDWLSFGQKTLVLGDPAQLPPVGGEGFFTKRNPNFQLTDIHRQAKGNPIIDLATMVRNGDRPKPGTYGNSKVLRKDSLNPDYLRTLVMESDQVIVGKNETRHVYNNRIRQLRGFDSKYPLPGETLVCLRNNHDLGLLNGALYKVDEVRDRYDDIERIDLTVSPLDQKGGSSVEVHCHLQHFLGREESLRKQYWSIKEADEFDFGYALTCHKVQGSQFKNPLIFDQSAVFRANAYKWLYTAITRAQESVTLVV
jgi:exodeoxyribonuclease V